MSTITQQLLDRLQAEPEAVACQLVAADGTSERITVARLLRKAMAYAEVFGPARQRELIAVCIYHGLDLHAAFLGGLLAGHIPTMLPPPSPRMEARKYTDSFRRVMAHIRPGCIVMSETVAQNLDPGVMTDFPASRLVTPTGIAEVGTIAAPRGRSPDDIAFVQHSSGTTGLQKGIALSHRAVLAHNHSYATKLSITPHDTIASWLPLYHDMGFIAAFIMPLCNRVPLVEISPFDWVAKPALLLEAIHRHRATLCWLPNFAFSFMAQSIRVPPPGIDLSSIRAFVNSSEPVTDRAMQEFLEKFESLGARREQLTVSYAMAENVYAVTQSQPGEYRTLTARRESFLRDGHIEPETAPSALMFVSNGTPVEGTKVRILDDHDADVGEHRVGNIALSGDFRFSGYYGRDDLTQAAMTQDGWYRTGDLGFVADGHLYVTGRKKDLVIIQGRNFYPADIEEAVALVEGVKPGRVVAFGLRDEASGTEGLVVLAESLPSGTTIPAKLALEIRKAIAQQFDFTPADARVVPERWLVKSTSGKLARADNRDKYLAEFRKQHV